MSDVVRQLGVRLVRSSRRGPADLSSCLWGPSEPNSVVGDTEGSAVAWCTQPGHGTRVLPPGSITALQFIRTSAYVQVSGIIDQTKMNVRRHFRRSG